MVGSGNHVHDGPSRRGRPELSDGVVGASDLACAAWRKSSYSTYNGACVEVAVLRDDLVGVRDTKDADPTRALLFSKADWNALLADLKGGR